MSMLILAVSVSESPLSEACLLLGGQALPSALCNAMSVALQRLLCISCDSDTDGAELCPCFVQRHQCKCRLRMLGSYVHLDNG